MNYIKHLAGFFDRVAADEGLNPTHVSMYVSLFQFWNASRFQNPISISRNELMKVSKISAKATYHKCMRELNDFGYLKYMPSYNPFKGSLVHLFNFQTGSEQPPDTHPTKNDTGSEQAQEPYINTSNIINQTSLNLGKQAHRCSSFVVSKQSCQTIAAAAINLFINFYGIAAPAMPFGCSASLRSLSCCLQFLLIPHGSYCVLHATSFISSSVPLHYTTFASYSFASRPGIL